MVTLQLGQRLESLFKKKSFYINWYSTVGVLGSPNLVIFNWMGTVVMLYNRALNTFDGLQSLCTIC